MKKTFSLKLMLLGLLIGFGSMTTYAAKFFVNGGVIYEKFLGGVRVAGVTGIPSSGILTIPTSVTDTADPNMTPYNVVAIADDWYKPGQLKFVKENQADLIEQTKDLTKDVNAFKLVIDAKYLTTISTEALQPLSQGKKLSGFEVTSNAGLGAIPNYAFVVGKKTHKVEVCPDENDPDVKDAKANLAKLKDNEDAQIEDLCAVKNGKYQGDGDFNGAQVYHVTVNKAGADVSAYGVLAVVGQEDGLAADGSKAYHLLQIKADGSLGELLNPMKVRYSTTGDPRLVGQEIESTSNPNKEYYVAEPVAEDYENCTIKIKGLKTLAQEATNKYNTLKELLNNLKLSKVWTDKLDALQKTTNALSKWTVYSQKVDAVRDLWNVPYIVTNAVAKGTTEGTFDDGIGGNRALTAAEKTAVTNIINKMRELEFTNITEIVPNENANQKQDCSNNLQYWLTGDYKTLFGQYLPEGVKEVILDGGKLAYSQNDGSCVITKIEMGYKKGDQIQATGTISGDFLSYGSSGDVEVSVVNNAEINVEGTTIPGATIYVKLGSTAPIVYFYLDGNNKVYKATSDDQTFKAEMITAEEGEGKFIGGITENSANKTLVLGDGTVVAVAAYAEGDYSETPIPAGYRKPSFETVQSYLAEAQLAKDAAQKEKDEFIAYTDPVEVDEEGNPIKYTMAEFEEYVNGPLLTAKNNADKALEAAEWAEDVTDAEVEAWKATVACHDEYVLDITDIDKNETLTSVNIESAPSLTSIGVSAFQNCVKAVLAGSTAKLPTALTTIKEHAFQGAAMANPDFTTLTNLWRIGDYAFAQSGATDGDFHDAANLGIEDPDPTKAGYFGTNVFDDCAIVNLMLKGTPLKAIPGNLAQGLKREAAPFMDACGYFWNFDNDKNKLTDHALTADEIAVLKPYLWKDKTATELEALVGTKLNDEQVSIITAAGLVKETKRPVNISLIEASLPVAITVIEAVTEPNPVVANKVYGTYENCINLATLTGGIPAGVTTIGYKAFYATKIDEFNLSALDKLSTIGKYAFGGNSELTKVTLPKASAWNEEGLTELPEGVFECDSELEELILNPELTCLPKGLLKGSKIEKLDLSNTQIEVLPDLFEATSDDPNTTLVEVILPEEKLAADGLTVEIPGLKVIMDNAFANMHALKGKKQEDGSYRFEIPSTVWIMRPGVFFNDIALEEVYAMDSRLTNLGVNTFKGCASLKKFTFVTLEAINSTWTNYPRVRYKNIPCEEMIRFNAAQFNFDDMQFFGCPYGDPQTEGKDKRPIVVMTQESYDQIKAEYWNHPSYDKLYSRIEIYQPTIALTKIGGKYYGTYYNANYGTWVPMSEGKVYTAYQDGGTIYAYSAKHNNGYYKIPAAGESTFIYDTEARYAQGSAAVLIVSDHENVKVERHSTMYKKNHTTLDIENELRVTANNGSTGYPIATTTADFIYKFSFDAEGPGFFHWVTKPDNKVVPVGKVVFPMSDYQGTANPNVFGGLTGGEIHAPVEPGSRPARLNIVFVDDETSTGIKDYIKSHNLNDGAIYNLQGVRVKNTVKGQMYIQNGQKFIQK